MYDIKDVIESDGDETKVNSFVVNEVNKHRNPNAISIPLNIFSYTFEGRVNTDDKYPIKINYRKMKVCVNDKLIKDAKATEFVYVFLYVCKNLKLLRNDANHALGGSALDIETLKTWIEIYLILMREVIKKGR